MKKRRFFRAARLLALAAFLASARGVLAGDAAEDWAAIIALDAGPREQPKSAEGARQMVVSHLARQEKALRGFLAAHAQDARVFEVRLRLARLLQIRADFENSTQLQADSRRMLEELEKSATPEQRPELEFAKVARLMRSLRAPTAAQRADVLNAARRFQAAYPADRRLAGLLAEVATLFDAQPRTKEALLEDARAVAADEELKQRIADDLKRVRLFGEEVPLRFTTLQGAEMKPEELRGRPTFVIFFASFSPPATAAVTALQEELAQLPKGSVRVVGIGLDAERETLIAFLQARGITWPVAYDSRGWQSPLLRELGINAIPTVWLLDARGRLRSLNALEGAAGLATQLLRER